MYKLNKYDIVLLLLDGDEVSGEDKKTCGKI